jgi:hypothetical protein
MVYSSHTYQNQGGITMKRILAISLGVAFVLSLGLGACKKKEEQPVPQAPQMPHGMAPGMAPGMPPQMAPGGAPQMGPGGAPGQPTLNIPKGETKLVVPESLKGKWSAVKIVVTDKGTQKSDEYTVKLNSEFKIPSSNLKIAVGDFLPDFRMEGTTVTSASDEPKNPAVGVKIFEADKQIFPAPGKKWGWLYAKPELRGIHPFEHPKYSIFLKEAVKKG